jgi:hypothetical protein
MRFIPSLAVLFALVIPGAARLNAAEEDGVALAIIYDTSGSMNDLVADKTGKPTPKYVIANRALIAVANQIQAFATNTAGGPPRNIQTGLFTFYHDSAREVVKFGPFDAAALQEWAMHFSNPTGNTPLGNALRVAAQPVLNSPLPRKHVLIITDGINTAGPQPATVLPKLKEQAAEKQSVLSVHFVAFDVDAKVFDGVKKQGATVVGASNESQLEAQLKFILQRKILLEDEEPKKQ